MQKWLFQILNPLRRLIQRLFRVPTLGVKALVISAQDQILLVEHTYVEGWHLPGGGVDTGESPKMAIIRELKEETGVCVFGEPNLFAVYTHKIWGANDYPILYIVKDYKLDAPPFSSEIRATAWYSLDNLPSTLTRETRQRLKEYFEHHIPSEKW